MCPNKCESPSKVLESRPAAGENAGLRRRRRLCARCDTVFATYDNGSGERFVNSPRSATAVAVAMLP